MTLQDVINLIGRVLGVDLGFAVGKPVATICATIFLGLALYIASQLWLAHSNHKQDRRSYEYKRSQDVNLKRYESELGSVRELSRLFMELRLQTHQLLYCPKEEMQAVLVQWDSAYKTAALTLGEAAPVLNLRKLKDGSPTCGVHARNTNASNAVVSFSGVARRFAKIGALIGGDAEPDGAADRQVVDCRPSLYLRGVKFLDACMAARQKVLEDRLGLTGETCAPIVLYAPEDDRFVFLGADRQDAQCLNDGDIEYQLGQLYKKFVNCAFCRLRNSDTGSKDARRINRQSAWRAGRADCFPWLDKHGRECPHTKDSSGD